MENLGTCYLDGPQHYLGFLLHSDIQKFNMANCALRATEFHMISFSENTCVMELLHHTSVSYMTL